MSITRLPSIAWDPAQLTAETPIASADPDTARLLGGPLLGAVLDALPADFAADRLLVDALLTWLPPDYSPSPGEWACELALHGEAAGVREPAGAEVIEVAFSAVTALSLLVGDAPDGWQREMPSGSGFLAAHAHAARRRAATWLEPAIERGALTETRVEPGTPARYPASTFRRYAPAARDGFCFVVRVVRGSDRPILNLLRKSARLAFY